VWASGSGSVQELATPAGKSSSAHGINESGVVAGNVDGWATVWTGNVPTTIPSASPASAFTINDLGDVPVAIGSAAAVWHVPTGIVTPLVAPLGATGPVVATGINNSGNLSGWAEFPAGLRPVRWMDGVPELLDASVAGVVHSAGLGINDDDDVAGYLQFTSGRRAAVWSDGELTLVAESSSFGYTINAVGVVAGAKDFVAHLFVPADVIALDIVGLVQDLVESGDLQANDVAALQSQLEAAADRLAAGDIAAGIRLLRAFNNRVTALVRSGRLSELDAEQLLDAANDLIAGLEG
jgi:hypothetical protein